MFLAATISLLIRIITSDYFFREPVDYAILAGVVLGYFVGMHYLKKANAVSDAEETAGYTTSGFFARDLDEVHWPSGIVIRSIGEPPLRWGTRRRRMVEARDMFEQEKKR